MEKRKLFGLVILVALGFVALSVFASAVILPPAISIGASPNPTGLTSTITAVAVDLSGSGIANVKIYENGNLVRQCSSSTCVYVASHIVPGVRNYYATTLDNLGSSATSSTINVNFLNSAPILNYIGDKNVNAGSELRFTDSGYDYNNDVLNYFATGLPSGAIFDLSTGNFVWSTALSQAGTYFVNFSVSDGSLIDSEVVTINVLDVKAPSYSNLAVNPGSPAVYSPSQNYSFRARWTDENAISSVWIEFNGKNYASSLDGSDYVFAITGLGAGNYSYTWYANDSSGNINKTSTMNYVVNKAVPALSLSVLPSTSVASNTLTNVTGFGCPGELNGTCKLYRNGVEVNNSDRGYLSNGVYNYVFNTTGNENYTSASVSCLLYVNAVSSGGGTDDDSGRIRTISTSDLIDGYYVYMSIGDSLKFDLCSSPNYIKLTDLDSVDREAYFRTLPKMQNFVLSRGEKIELDLNSNSVSDIHFSVVDFGGERVKVYIKGLTDSCRIELITPELVSEEVFVEKIYIDKKESAVLSYIIAFLMLGIFLSALAILLSLLFKIKRK